MINTSRSFWRASRWIFTSFLSHVYAFENRDADPVVFVHDEMRPIPEACDAISFGCGPFDDDVLSTAASDSEELVGDCSNSLPLSGQEKRTSPSYNELLEVVTNAVDGAGMGQRAQTKSGPVS